MGPALHADIAHLSWLVGTWAGSGAGRYPTIDSFEYTEQVEIGHVGKPFLSYVQRTKDAQTGLPLHSESGYLRPVGTNRIELVIAQPSGILELHGGTVEGRSIHARSESVIVTPTAKQVAEVHRFVTVDGDRLSYRVEMAAVGLPLQHHLEAMLHRA
jgi:hypothetical protein